MSLPVLPAILNGSNLIGTYPYVKLLPNPNGSTASTVVDNFGNVIMPASSEPNVRSSPPPSPPWGLNVPKNMTINVPYKIQPLGVVPAPGSGCPQNGSRSVLLCTLIPLLGEQRDITKHHKVKLQRVEAIRNRKRRLFGKSWMWFSDSKHRKLKRLQRRPLLKAKKQEVYEKLEKRNVRRKFKKRQRRAMMDLYISNDNSLSVSSILNGSSTSRERSESPFECPLWCCKRKRRSRREEYEQDYEFFRRTRLRKDQPSRLSCRSDKSRSPITIRSSPFI